MIELLLVAVAIFGFALVSTRLDRSALTAPMVFTTVGLVVGREGLGWFDLDLEGEAVSILVEATLVLVLFTDAARMDLRALRRDAWLPGRLLGLGLPLSFLLGTGVALLIFPDLGLAGAALLAAVLSPTDAALGQAVVSDQRLPVRLRQGLNVESGLNDGIVLPVVSVCLALTAAEEGGLDTWGGFVLAQIGFGLLTGVGVGAAGGWLLERRSRDQRVDAVFRQLATLSLAAGAYAVSELSGGNGFIAAFTAGLVFGHVARHQGREIEDFTVDEGHLLSAITFTVFGALFAGSALTGVTWSTLVYAVLSLTAVRMLAVWIALWRTRTLVETRLFAGWFGPRGLASILFALLVVDELDGAPSQTIFVTATLTILFSVYAHGASANAWSGRLGRRLAQGDAGLPENQTHHGTGEMPTRWGR